MSYRFVWAAAALGAAALLLMTGCNERPGSRIVARVNGTPLTVDDLSYRPGQGHSRPSQYRSKTVDEIVKQELLFQQGLRLGLDRDPSYRRELAKLKSQPPAAQRLEMARRVFNTQVASRIEVTHEEAREFYDRCRDQLATELHLQLIRVDSKELGERILKSLQQGVPFETLAAQTMGKALVDGKSTWELGFLKWEQIPVDFTSRIYTLKPGEVSGMLGSGGAGYHIVKLIERRAVSRPDYDAVSAMMMNRLRDRKLLERYNDYVAQLRREARVETF